MITNVNLHPEQGTAATVADVSGYAIFSQGDVGEAHALAHRLTDTGQFEIGHRLLGAWLQDRSGKGSDWVHVQFHMAVFELALGKWHDAYQRFLCEVLPTAASTDEALTDAPALLWRLAVSAPNPIELPWQPLRRTALACIRSTDDPFVQIHQLLALAGAADSASLRDWIQQQSPSFQSHTRRTVYRFAWVCLALSCHAYTQANAQLQAILPQLTEVGGSHAQGRLFEQLATWTALLSQQKTEHAWCYRHAA